MVLGTCPDCGNEVSSRAPACPQCGRPSPGQVVAYAAPSPHVVSPGYNGFAIASFVLGLVSLFCLNFLAVLALIFGPTAISRLNAQRRQGGPEQKGRWMAITGIVLGLISLTIATVVIVGVMSEA